MCVCVYMCTRVPGGSPPEQQLTHHPAVIVLVWTSLVAPPVTPPVCPVPWELQLFALTLPHCSTAVTTVLGSRLWTWLCQGATAWAAGEPADPRAGASLREEAKEEPTAPRTPHALQPHLPENKRDSLPAFLGPTSQRETRVAQTPSPSWPWGTLQALCRSQETGLTPHADAGQAPGWLCPQLQDTQSQHWATRTGHSLGTFSLCSLFLLICMCLKEIITLLFTMHLKPGCNSPLSPKTLARGPLPAGHPL